MPNKKQSSGKQVSIKTGNISNVSGQVNIAGSNINAEQGGKDLDRKEIEQLFDKLFSAVESRPETSAKDKEGLKAEIEEIQETVVEAVEKQKEVNEGFFLRRFRNISRMAPDILDVVVATLGNPLAGLGVAVKKIAQMAKEE